MFDVDDYVLGMLQHADRKLLKEIDRIKKNPPKTGEPTLFLTLSRYENNPFLLYSCLHYARQQGISVCFSPANQEPGQEVEPKAKRRA